MRVKTILSAALVVALMPGVARADDPNDPTMRSAAARARDHAMIRQLNLNELARTRARDARFAGGWEAYRQVGGSDPRTSNRGARYVPEAEYAQASEGYAHDREQYERRMAKWRRAVAACRAGDYDACGN
ncbi:MAG: hypothetical protein H7346_12180 [Burkholderiaceae bacterium]|nr:hypothetical protein [Burkholderiaceae bacterium]